MNGGTIKENIAQGSSPNASEAYGAGGGVDIVGSTSTFTMNGGTITNNKAIEENTALENGGAGGTGGGVRSSLGAVIMNGGVISYNKASDGRSGGGLYIISNFTMNNGTITGNIAGWSGGGVILHHAGSPYFFSMNMNGGEITNNKALFLSGGGVCVMINSSEGKYTVMTMAGGTIAGNEAGRTGGGVGVFNNTSNGGTDDHPGVFKKIGGTIYGNDGTPNGNKATGTLSQLGHAADYGDFNGAVEPYNFPINWRATTVGPDQNLDSEVPDAAGGWTD
jgi:hypothetical protein